MVGDAFGALVQHGDFNADGVEDMVVSAPGSSNIVLYRGVFRQNDDTGHVYQARWQLRYGHAMAMASGDFDGDGIDDLAIGTDNGSGGLVEILTSADARRPLSIRTTVSLGGGVNGAGANPGWPLPTGTDDFGWALAVADLNGDNFDDLLIGAPGANAINYSSSNDAVVGGNPPGWPANFANTGAVFVLDGDQSDVLVDRAAVLDPYLTRMTLSRFPVRGAHDGARFGAAIHAADLNMDSAPEVLVGAPLDYRIQNVGSTGLPSYETQSGYGATTRTVEGSLYVFDLTPTGFDSVEQHGVVDAEFGTAVESSYVRRYYGSDSWTGPNACGSQPRVLLGVSRAGLRLGRSWSTT